MSIPQEDKEPFWQNVIKETGQLVPFVGPILSGMIQRNQDRKAIDRQNEYNKPINQLARLREAGLPYAAMTNAISGNQSQTQESTSTGISEGIQSYVHTNQQRKQIELLDAQIQATKTQAAKTGVEANAAAYDLQLRQMDPTAGEPVSMGARMAKLDYEIKLINKEISESSKQITQLNERVQRELTEDGTLSSITRQQLQGIINGVKLGNQQINRGLVMDTLIETMKKGGIKLHEALVMAFMTNQLGAGSIHFPDYNPRHTNINVTGEQYHEHIRRD